MKENSTSILEIESLAIGGDGVGRLDGKVTFVPGTAPGDKVVVNVVAEKKRMQRARVVELLKESPDRREPRCPLSSECGGCQWLHINEAAQRQAKQSFLEKAVGISGVSIIPSPRSTGYRRLARLRLGKAPDKALGFNAGGSSKIVDVTQCLVLEPALNRGIKELRDKLAPHCKGPAEIKLAGGDAGVGVSFMAKDMFEPEFYRVAQSLVPSVFCGVTTEVDSLFALVAGAPEVVVEGSDGKPLIVPIGSFGQANGEVNKILGDVVCDWALSGGYRSAVELFSGAGNLTVGLARFLKKLAAVELDSRAVKAARRNIANRDLRGVTVYQGEALEVYEKVGAKMDLVVLDPPRTGHAELAAKIAEANHRAVIYVSCDPATLERDIKIMSQGGYKPVKAKGFDMFPQTPHLESLVLLER